MFLNSLPALRRVPVFLKSQPPPRAFLAHATTRPFRLPQHIVRPLILTPLQARGVASSVSGRPGSQTPSHAAQNIKEEVGNAAGDFAKTIAGANFNVDNVAPRNETFVGILDTYCYCLVVPILTQLGITSAVAHSVPRPVFLTGLAGK